MKRIPKHIAQAITLASACLFTLSACTSTPATEAPIISQTDRTVLPYEEIARAYNARASRLGRVWARAVVRFEYVDQDGDLRREQGEGHLQYIAPRSFALSVGKLGETLAWLGCDSERYWLFEPRKADRVSIGAHINAGKPCSRSLGLPAHPLALIDLLGVTPLPTNAARASARTGRSRDGRWIVVEVDGQGSRTQLFLDPQTYEPGWIKSLDPITSETLVFAELTNYAPVELKGAPGYFPKIASRISVRRPDERGHIRLSLAGLTDARSSSSKLPPEAFSFDALRAAFHPSEIIQLDQDCPGAHTSAAPDADIQEQR